MIKLLIFGIGGTELVLIVVLVLLLFGGAKIPELMRGVGKGVKSFRDGMEGIDEAANADTESSDKSDPTARK